MHSTCIAVCQTRCQKAWERPALRSQQRTYGILPGIPCSYTAGHRGKDSFSKIISTARHTWCHSNLGFSVLTCILSPLSKNSLSVFATISAYCKTPVCQRNPSDRCMRVCISAFIPQQAIPSFCTVFHELQPHVLWQLSTSKDRKMMGLYTKPVTVTSWKNAFKSSRTDLWVIILNILSYAYSKKLCSLMPTKQLTDEKGRSSKNKRGEQKEGGGSV